MLGMKATTLTLEAIEQYRNWCTARGRAENTVKAYCSDLREFLKAAGENGAIVREEYEELAMSWLNLTRNSLSPKTTARRLTSIKGFAKWAGWGPVLVDYIAPTPGRTIPHPIREGVVGLRAMIDKAKNHEQVALVALGGFVGCRVSESLSLTVSSFDAHDMLVTIRGKGDKTRTVPLSEEAWTFLIPAFAMAYTKEDQRLISYKDRFARQIVTNLGARAGLSRRIASHDLRATFATVAFDKANNIRVVQELLGHSSVETTQGYTGVGVAQMREAVKF